MDWKTKTRLRGGTCFQMESLEETQWFWSGGNVLWFEYWCDQIQFVKTHAPIPILSRYVVIVKCSKAKYNKDTNVVISIREGFYKAWILKVAELGVTLECCSSHNNSLYQTWSVFDSHFQLLLLCSFWLGIFTMPHFIHLLFLCIFFYTHCTLSSVSSSYSHYGSLPCCV